MKGTSTNMIKRSVLAVFMSLAVGIIAYPGAGTTQAEQGADGEGPTLIACPGAPAQCFTDVLPSNPFFENANRLYMQEVISGYACGGAGEPCDAESRPYYRPGNTVTRQQMTKFVDNARRLPQIRISVEGGEPPVVITNSTGTAIQGNSNTSSGVEGRSDSGYGVTGTSNSIGVYGQSDGNAVAILGIGNAGGGVRGQSQTGTGMAGASTTGYGVHGFSSSTYGVLGESNGDSTVAGVTGSATNAVGVMGSSTNSYGLYGESTGTGAAGLYAVGFSGAIAAHFQGNITVTGNCTGCFGPSRVDHPLDPENQYLYQSPVQSDDMMNIYNGNVITDRSGQAVVRLPGYFEALNSDFRYQLTVIGTFAQAIVLEKIEDNRFTIKTDKPNVEVSWQVTGIRNDAFAKANRVAAEQAKPADEQGLYLHPGLYGQPDSKMVDYSTPRQAGK